MAKKLEALLELIRLHQPGILRLSDIRNLAKDLRAQGKLQDSVTEYAILDALEKQTGMRAITISLPHRSETVFVWGAPSPLAIAVAAKPGSYLCHYTAAAVHELTTQTPSVIYANIEQRPHFADPESLTQKALDQAFRRPQRLTKNTGTLDKYRVVYINGMHTGQLGVASQALSTGEWIRVTDLPRTLIDISVRPMYAGGVSEVLSAYRSAVRKLTPGAIATYLARLKYVYPYRQAIGYYLQRADADQAEVDSMRSPPFDFDFYLAHAMHNTTYVPEWRLHVPIGL